MVVNCVVDLRPIRVFCHWGGGVVVHGAAALGDATPALFAIAIAVFTVCHGLFWLRKPAPCGRGTLKTFETVR